MRNDTISERYGPQPASRAIRQVRFGAAAVALAELTEADHQRAIQHSQAALAALAEWLLGKQGIDTGARQDLPRYALDPDDPTLLIRTCAGEVARGRMEQGAFQVRP